MKVTIEYDDLQHLTDRINELEDCLTHALADDDWDKWKHVAATLLTQDEEAGELEPQEPEPVQCPNCGRTDTMPLALAEEPGNQYHHCAGCGHVWTTRDAQ